MAKLTSKVSEVSGRIIKGIVGIVLIPAVIGLAVAFVRGLEAVKDGAHTAAYWFTWGLGSYVGLHLLLYRPKVLFGLNHALLARLGTWLFGGQVSTVGAEESGATKSSKPKKRGKKRSKDGDEDGGGGDAPEAASTLVVISPYLVPLYVILVCLFAWTAHRKDYTWLFHALVGTSIGAALAFHISMTGEDLQEHAEQFPIETRLMALAVSILASLAVATLCLPLAYAGFSAPSVWTDAAATTRAIYTNIFQTLF